MNPIRFRIIAVWVCLGMVCVSQLIGCMTPELWTIAAGVVGIIRLDLWWQSVPRQSPQLRLIVAASFGVLLFFCVALFVLLPEVFYEPAGLAARFTRTGLWLLLPPVLAFTVYGDRKAWKKSRASHPVA